MGAGGQKMPVTKYGMSLHFGVCLKADTLLRIVIKEKEAWTGVVEDQQSFIIHKPELFGGIDKEGGVDGVVYWLPGNSDQIVDDVLARKFGRANGADCPGYRGIATIAFVGPAGTPYSGFDWSKKVKGKKGFYLSANVPYLPGFWVTVRRAPVGLDESIALVPRLGENFFPYAAGSAGGFGLESAQFTPDGRTMVVVAGGNYQVWDVIGHTLTGTYSTTAGAFALAEGGFYALNGFAFQDLIFVSLGGGETVVVDNADFPGIMGKVFYVNGMVYMTGALGGAGYQVSTSGIGTPISYVGVIDWFFGMPNSETWGVADSGSDLVLTNVTAGTSFTVASPTTGTAYGMMNVEGNILVYQNGYLILIDVDTETVVDSASGIDIDTPELAFRNVIGGSRSIWGEVTEYNTVTLAPRRTVNLSDWAPAGSIQSGVYSPTDHALISKPLFTNEFQFRQLDRGGYDANPAHVIFEALTNTDWGMGSPTTLIDVASFEDAAITLSEESLGISLIWTRQSSVQDFIQEVLDHIQGVVFVDPSTGLLTLRLIRGDYNPATLDVIDPSNARMISFSRKIWGDIANEINVSWTNPDTEQEETVTVQDLASIAAQGGIVSDSRNYYGVRTAILAQRLAQRELRSAGAPLAGCEVEVNRQFWQARPASVYKVTWPEHGLSEVVFRVAEVDYGKPGDMSLKLTLIEDVYGLDVGEYTEPPTTLWEDPATPPEAIEQSKVITLPLYMATQSTVDTSGAVYPEVLAGILGTTSNEDVLDYELWGEFTDTLGNVSWSKIGDRSVLGYGTLTDALDAEAATAGVGISDLVGTAVPEAGAFALIGDGGEDECELALVTAAASTYTLSRGVLDTVPRAWPATTPVWFIASDALIEDTSTRSAGETVRYRLLTRTSLGLLPLEQSPVVSYELTERPWLPTRPANITIDSVQFNTVDTPVDMIGETEVPVTWSNRNRLLEDGQVLVWTDGDVTPETDQTTTITIFTADETTVLDTITGLSGTSHDIPIASFLGVGLAKVVLTASRTDDDGTFESLQGHGIWVQVDEVGGARVSEDGDLRVTEDGDPRVTED